MALLLPCRDVTLVVEEPRLRSVCAVGGAQGRLSSPDHRPACCALFLAYR